MSGKRTPATSYFVLPYVFVDDDIVTGQLLQCTGASAAISCARGLVDDYGAAGASALQKPDRQGDNLHVLCEFGDVPHGEHTNLANGWHVVTADEQWGGVDVVG